MGHVEPIKIGEIETKKKAPAIHRWVCGVCRLVSKEQHEGACPKCSRAWLYELKPKQVWVNRRRYWVAPCHDWSAADQQAFMQAEDMPRNPIKMTPLGMSGECFCGAFAKPGEINLIRRYAPDVAEEIDRLTTIARDCGKHDVWGTRPDRKKGVVIAKSGPLCSSCDIRASLAGIQVEMFDGCAGGPGE